MAPRLEEGPKVRLGFIFSACCLRLASQRETSAGATSAAFSLPQTRTNDWSCPLYHSCVDGLCSACDQSRYRSQRTTAWRSLGFSPEAEAISRWKTRYASSSLTSPLQSGSCLRLIWTYQ